MKHLGWIPIALVLALAGCGDYKGPSRPFDGSYSGITTTVQGHSSAYKKADESPLGYLLSETQECYSTYSSSADGNVAATCLAAEISACGADADCIRAALN